MASEDLMAYMAGQDGNNGGMFGGNWMWIIVVFALLFGWGRNGFAGGAADGALTRSDLCEGFNFQNIENGVRGIQQGLCDGFYAMNTGLLNGFNGVQRDIAQAQYNTQNCCCETQRLIERGFCDVINAGNANTQRIIDHMTNSEMQALRDQLQTANFQLSQQAQNATLISTLRPTPIPSYITCSPYESALMYSGYNRGGCGCC